MQSQQIYICMFQQIYTHRTMVSPDLWLLRPFLVFSWMIMPVMAGVSRYGMNQSHALDVFWGFIMGCIIAVYIVSDVIRLQL